MPGPSQTVNLDRNQTVGSGLAEHLNKHAREINDFAKRVNTGQTNGNEFQARDLKHPLIVDRQTKGGGYLYFKPGNESTHNLSTGKMKALKLDDSGWKLHISVKNGPMWDPKGRVPFYKVLAGACTWGGVYVKVMLKHAVHKDGHNATIYLGSKHDAAFMNKFVPYLMKSLQAAGYEAGKDIPGDKKLAPGIYYRHAGKNQGKDYISREAAARYKNPYNPKNVPDIYANIAKRYENCKTVAGATKNYLQSLAGRSLSTIRKNKTVIGALVKNKNLLGVVKQNMNKTKETFNFKTISTQDLIKQIIEKPSSNRIKTAPGEVTITFGTNSDDTFYQILNEDTSKQSKPPASTSRLTRREFYNAFCKGGISLKTFFKGKKEYFIGYAKGGKEMITIIALSMLPTYLGGGSRYVEEVGGAALTNAYQYSQQVGGVNQLLLHLPNTVNTITQGAKNLFFTCKKNPNQTITITATGTVTARAILALLKTSAVVKTELAMAFGALKSRAVLVRMGAYGLVAYGSFKLSEYIVGDSYESIDYKARKAAEENKLKQKWSNIPQTHCKNITKLLQKTNSHFFKKKLNMEMPYETIPYVFGDFNLNYQTVSLIAHHLHYQNMSNHKTIFDQKITRDLKILVQYYIKKFKGTKNKKLIQHIMRLKRYYLFISKNKLSDQAISKVETFQNGLIKSNEYILKFIHQEKNVNQVIRMVTSILNKLTANIEIKKQMKNLSLSEEIQSLIENNKIKNPIKGKYTFDSYIKTREDIDSYIKKLQTIIENGHKAQIKIYKNIQKS